jgi:hypothetical protein
LDSGEIVFGASQILWSADEVLAGNTARLDGRPASVLFFANAGVDGILFGHPISDTGDVEGGVIAWYPIEDEQRTVAQSFNGWIEGWLGGTIAV